MELFTSHFGNWRNVMEKQPQLINVTFCPTTRFPVPVGSFLSNVASESVNNLPSSSSSFVRGSSTIERKSMRSGRKMEAQLSEGNPKRRAERITLNKSINLEENRKSVQVCKNQRKQLTLQMKSLFIDVTVRETQPV